MTCVKTVVAAAAALLLSFAPPRCVDAYLTVPPPRSGLTDNENGLAARYPTKVAEGFGVVLNATGPPVVANVFLPPLWEYGYEEKSRYLCPWGDRRRTRSVRREEGQEEDGEWRALYGEKESLRPGQQGQEKTYPVVVPIPHEESENVESTGTALPIAILVQRGRCSLREKAMVAWKLNRDLRKEALELMGYSPENPLPIPPEVEASMPRIDYLLFYDHDPTRGGWHKEGRHNEDGQSIVLPYEGRGSCRRSHDGGSSYGNNADRTTNFGAFCDSLSGLFLSHDSGTDLRRRVLDWAEEMLGVTLEAELGDSGDIEITPDWLQTLEDASGPYPSAYDFLPPGYTPPHESQFEAGAGENAPPERWHFPVTLDGIPLHPPETTVRDHGRSGSKLASHTWVAYLLIANLLVTLLLTFPTLAAMYRWFKAGGRIHLCRRIPVGSRSEDDDDEEDGDSPRARTRIVWGPHLVQPEGNWRRDSAWWAGGSMFGNGNGDVQMTERRASRKMTREEVLALPEIEYAAPGEARDEAEGSDGPEDATGEESMRNEEDPVSSNDDNTGKGPAQPSSSSAALPPDDNTGAEDGDSAEPTPSPAALTPNDGTNGDNDGNATGSATTQPPSSTASSPPQPSQSASTPADPSASTTTCTSCSVCIDDFTPGEKLLLLPRCHHAFHAECIMPWLTERSARCPLCKRNVRTGEEDEDEEDEDEDEDGDQREDEDNGEFAQSFFGGQFARTTNPF